MKIVSVIRHRKWWVIAALLVLGIGFFVLRSRNSKPEFDVYSVTTENIEEGIEVSGTVDADRRANMRFLAGGKVVYLPVIEGQFVKKWQIIAGIDKQDLQKNLQKDLNDYMIERLDFEQSKDDKEDQAKTDTVLRAAQQDQLTLNNSVLDVEIRDIAIRNANLIAPFDGVITKLPIRSTGIPVLSSDVFEIVDPSTLLFEAEVDEVDVARVKTGMPVRIILDAYPDEPIEATISFIGLSARTSSTSSAGTVFPVKVSLKSNDVMRYRLGMNGTMTIIFEQKENIKVIPIEATITRDDKTYVRVRDDSKEEGFREQEVQLGLEGEEKIELISGLSDTDEIVVPK